MKICIQCGKPEGEVVFYKNRNSCKSCIRSTQKIYNNTEAGKLSLSTSRKKWNETYPEKAKVSYEQRKVKTREATARARSKRIADKPIDKKICSKCRAEKYLDRFSKQKSGPMGRRSRCKVCESEYRTRNDPVKIKASGAIWRKNNPGRILFNTRNNQRRRRLAKQDGYFTDIQWRELLDVTGHKCLSCGVREQEAIYRFAGGGVKRGRLTPDHVIPVVKGGSDRIENIQPLCLPCNLNKGTKTTKYYINRSHHVFTNSRQFSSRS